MLRMHIQPVVWTEFELLVNAIVMLLKKNPCVIIIDDCDYADESSLGGLAAILNEKVN